MIDLDVFRIRVLPIIFGWYKDPVICTYHHDASSVEVLKIYVERNMSGDHQRLYLFELVRKGSGYFILKAFSETDADADVAGKEKEEVINFVIKKIITETLVGFTCWVENHPDKEREYLDDKIKLKKNLKKLIENFIG